MCILRKKKKGMSVFMLGAFPPPVGGAAKNTKIIHDEISASGINVVPLNTSANELAHTRNIKYHLHRFLINFSIIVTEIFRFRKKDVIYTVPDGGFGVWYTLVHLIIARARSSKQIIHHRTYKYIDNRSLPMRAIVSLTRETSKHVFLSIGMARKYIHHYGCVDFCVATNARFVRPVDDTELLEESKDILVLGHLSNLCQDKGFFQTADAFERCIDAGHDCEIIFAGPALEEKVNDRISYLIEKYGRLVEYMGPLYGDNKKEFYKKIDVFLFPTQFDLEAQPNVIYEAQSFGIPVVTVARGCIDEMVPDFAGLVVKRDSDFAAETLIYLESIDFKVSLNTKKRILQHSRYENERSLEQYKDLYNSILEPSENSKELSQVSRSI